MDPLESLSEFVGNLPAVTKFKEWLREVLNDRTYKRRVCFLTGPTGCGKTTLIHLAMKEVGFQIKEFPSSDMRVKQGRQLLLQYLQFFDVVSMIKRKQTGEDHQRKSALVECIENMNGQSSQELYKSIRDMIKEEKTYGVPIVFTGILPFRGKRPLSLHAIFIHMRSRTSKELHTILHAYVKKRPSLHNLLSSPEKMLEITDKCGGDVRRMFSFLEMLSIPTPERDITSLIKHMDTHDICGPMASLRRILDYQQPRTIEQILLDAEVEGARMPFGIHGAYLEYIEQSDPQKKAMLYSEIARILSESSELLGQQNFNDSSHASYELTELAILYGTLGVRLKLKELADGKSKKYKKLEGGDENIDTPCLYRTLRGHANQHMKLNTIISQETAFWTLTNLPRIVQWLRAQPHLPDDFQKIKRWGILEDKID